MDRAIFLNDAAGVLEHNNNQTQGCSDQVCRFPLNPKPFGSTERSTHLTEPAAVIVRMQASTIDMLPMQRIVFVKKDASAA